MIIKCIENNIHSFSENSELFTYLTRTVHLDDGILPITKGREYRVYSVKYDADGLVKYLICNDDFPILEYPIFCLSVFFDLIDDRASKFWGDFPNEHQGQTAGASKLLTFREWNESEVFYENLVNGNETELDTFVRYKKLIDEES